MRIVQISDTHVSCDHPARIVDLERCVTQVNSLDFKPDIVIHTGDISHNGRAGEYASARRILDTLNTPYVVLAGNRDNRRALRGAFEDVPYLRADFPFVQYALEQFPVRLICLDSVSETSNKGHMCPERLADLEAMLDADASRPTVIFMHHPPFDIPVVPDPVQFEDRVTQEHVCGVIAAHGQISGLYCGHVHRDIIGRAGTDTRSVETRIMSCCALDLRKGEDVPANEETRLFKLHTIAQVFDP